MTDARARQDKNLGPCAHLDRLVHGLARLAGGRDRLEHHPAGSRRFDRAAGVDGERLRPELRGAADDRRGARRSPGAAAHVRRRPGAVRGGVGRLRAGAHDRLADRRARRARGRRSAGGAARDGAPERGVPAARAREGARHLQRRDRARPHRRPGRGRRYRRRRRLAMDFLAQRPDRPDRHPARAPSRPGELRHGHGSRHSRPCAGDRRHLRRSMGADARQQRRAGTASRSSRRWRPASCWRRRSSPGSCAPREPMVPMRLFRSRAFAAGNAAGFFMFATLYGALFFMAQFLQTAQGHGPLGAGLRLLPWTATLFVVAPIAGALVNRIGERPLIVCGLLLQAVGMAWIALIAAPDLAYAKLVAPLIVAGAGVSMAMPASQNAVLNAVAKTRDRQGVRHLQHVALSRRGVRDRDPGRGVRRDRKRRLPGGLQRRVRPRHRRRCRVVAIGSGRRPRAAQCGGFDVPTSVAGSPRRNVKSKATLKS